MIPFAIVVAADEAGGIGNAGDLVWNLPTDTAFLKRVTKETVDSKKRNAVVMGRKTWESIPKRFRPLRRRVNAVISRQSDYAVPNEVILADSVEGGLLAIGDTADIERVFVLGGGQIYQIALGLEACETVYLTRVEGRFDCDARFPDLGEGFELTESSNRHEENGTGFRFETYQRR